MSALLNLITDIYPPGSSAGIPISDSITVTLSGTNYNLLSLTEGIFLEGPNTDQYIGPGLIEQRFPNNISQGNVDSFLSSGRNVGVIPGAASTQVVSGNTVITFNPTLPLNDSTDYVINLSSILDSTSAAIAGFVTSSFTTSSGNIEIIPDNISSSNLNSGVLEDLAPGLLTAEAEALEVITTSPLDQAVDVSIEERQIKVTFSKDIDATSFVKEDIDLSSFLVSSHPSLDKLISTVIVKSISVVGSVLTIDI